MTITPGVLKNYLRGFGGLWTVQRAQERPGRSPQTAPVHTELIRRTNSQPCLSLTLWYHGLVRTLAQRKTHSSFPPRLPPASGQGASRCPIFLCEYTAALCFPRVTKTMALDRNFPFLRRRWNGAELAEDARQAKSGSDTLGMAAQNPPWRHPVRQTDGNLLSIHHQSIRLLTLLLVLRLCHSSRD